MIEDERDRERGVYFSDAVIDQSQTGDRSGKNSLLTIMHKQNKTKYQNKHLKSEMICL